MHEKIHGEWMYKERDEHVSMSQEKDKGEEKLSTNQYHHHHHHYAKPKPPSPPQFPLLVRNSGSKLLSIHPLYKKKVLVTYRMITITDKTKANIDFFFLDDTIHDGSDILLGRAVDCGMCMCREG